MTTTTTTKFATYPSLEDHVIVVSGGASGIGAAMVEQLSLQGAQVIFLDIATDLAEELIQHITAQSPKHNPIFHHCDVTDVEGALKPVAAQILGDHPTIHGLVNNAAGNASSSREKTLQVTSQAWDLSLSVNLSHQFFLAQALMPGLLAAGTASVINMGSIIWKIPMTGAVPYATCKAAVVGLTRTLAHEFGPQGVRFNCIMPGSVATEAEKKYALTPEYKELVLGRQALKKLTQPEDIARTAMWLLSDDSGAVTNQNIIVDAGWV